MARKRKTVDDKLEVLDSLHGNADPQQQAQRIKAALGDPHYRVVAKAAKLCAERLLYELEPDLLAAYRHFLQDPLKRDPNCMAKRAIAGALVDLDCHDVEFFIEGLAYRQMEPVWGGSVDTAIEIRCQCAMGLVATSYPRALQELLFLLNDSVANARLGALRAISCANPREAELLLRLKVLTGDPEPEVIGECFVGLLSVEPDESLPFVAHYLFQAETPIPELAALALGESRLEEALGYLKQAWDEAPVGRNLHPVLVRAAALHRSDAAFDWLLAIAETAEPSLVEEILEALAVYKHNAQLANRLGAVLTERDHPRLRNRFAQLWGDT